MLSINVLRVKVKHFIRSESRHWMANLIHCSLCPEGFGALGAWICPMLTLFMLFELVSIHPSMPTNAHTI